MNSRRKGYRIEKKVVDYLKSEGYEVHRPPQTQYGRNDIFGVWDLVAVNWKKRRIRFIQVKTEQTKGFVKIIGDWFEKYKFAYHTWELWVYYQKEGKFIVHEGDPEIDKEIIIVDRRRM